MGYRVYGCNMDGFGSVGGRCPYTKYLDEVSTLLSTHAWVLHVRPLIAKEAFVSEGKP